MSAHATADTYILGAAGPDRLGLEQFQGLIVCGRMKSARESSCGSFGDFVLVDTLECLAQTSILGCHCLAQHETDAYILSLGEFSVFISKIPSSK